MFPLTRAILAVEQGHQGDYGFGPTILVKYLHLCIPVGKNGLVWRDHEGV